LTLSSGGSTIFNVLGRATRSIELSKYINLNLQDRFIKTDTLRNSYLRYEESHNPKAKPYISFDSEDLELGIVSSQTNEIATAISSILSRSLEDGKDVNGGYLPPKVVERVQLDIISPFGVAHLWGVTGHRFVLSRSAGPDSREIIASILVSRSKDTIFFFTGRYNNIKHSTIEETVDLYQPVDSDKNQRWFDQFAFPPLLRFKPKFYHQIANFVVAQEYRGQGFAKFFIKNIVKYYSRDHILANKGEIEHSQYLLCGRGFWQIGDPPWLPKMKALGFYLRCGAESFFLENNWHTLMPVFNNGVRLSNVEYNASFGLPQMYENIKPAACSDEHLLERIPLIVALSTNPKAKLQYFQAMYNFL
jgi:hypothetical protein